MALDRRQLQLQADQALRRGDLAGAATCYRQLLAQTPNDLTLLQRLGDALARSGQAPEARAVFRRLAEEYWKGGLRSRALAVLRRAARLEGPDLELLALLGQRLLDEGLVVDAREPLAEAARLAEKAGDRAKARSLFERLADNQPKDLFSREALVRLADAAGEPAGRAKARMGLAAALARSGDAAGARRAVTDAFKADPDGLAALSGMVELRAALEGADLGGGDPPQGLSEAAVTGWALLWGGLREKLTAEVRRIAEGVAGTPGARSPHLVLAAARLLAEAGRGEACLALVDPLANNQQLDPDLASALGEIINIAARRAPQAPGLRELMERRRASTPQRSPEGTAHADGPAGGAVPSPAPAAPPPSDKSEEKALLPPNVQASALEAQAFLRQGLMEQARQAADAIPLRHRNHPKLAPLFERLFPGEARSAASKIAKAVVESADDELIVVVDSGEGSQPPRAGAEVAPPAGERPSPAPIHEAAPAPPKSAATGIDVHELEKSIGTEIHPNDAEMTYQMAVGLLEMELVDQAIPLLERVLGDPFRRIDAALLLARAQASLGAVDRGFAQALAVHRASLEAPPRMRGELLVVLADLALRLGKVDEAQEFVEALNQDLPGHRAANELADRLKASRT